MKKWMACILVLACSVLLFAGCGETGTEPTVTDRPDITEVPAERPDADEEDPTALPEMLAYEKTERSVQADRIRYYKTPEAYSFFVIQKNGRYGVIDQTGTMLMPFQDKTIHLSSGMIAGRSMRYVALGEAYEALDGSGGYEDKLTANAAPVKQKYIFAGGDYAGECCLYQGTACYLDEGFDGDRYVISPVPLNDTGWMNCAWSPDDGSVILLHEVKSLANGVVEYTSDLYALYDIKAKKLLTDFVYEDFDCFGFNENVLAVKKNGKWGFVDDTGKELGTFDYEDMEMEAPTAESAGAFRSDFFQNGYVTVKKDGKYGLLDATGTEVIPCTLAGVSGVNQEGYFWLSENGTDWSLCRMN